MLFNSIEFLIFLPLVFLLYWFVINNNIKNQNVLLIIASYIFYGWWDWRFLSLIIFSSIVDYSIGYKLSQIDKPDIRKKLLFLSIAINLGFLGFFKYYNFFVDSFSEAFTFLGENVDSRRLNIILPVGISFYTFQTLSYTIDVYRKKLEPTKDVFSFFAFVSFFPQLVAGPIERASNLLPQFYVKRSFDYNKAVIGLRQILWGLFKKVVIADNCATYATQAFDNYGSMNGSALVLGVIFFAFQIYGDFSGYSDIAIGTSRLFGFNLMKNFAFPYFSRNIAEFWRRWHISLSTWFRDYLYIPLGGSRGNIKQQVRNTFIIFIVSGFWHGANWTFVLWGAINACYFLPLLLSRKNRNFLDNPAAGKRIPSLVELIRIVLTFSIVCLSWVFFRAESIKDAFSYINSFLTQSILCVPNFDHLKGALFTSILLIIFIIIEWFGRENNFAIEVLGSKNRHAQRYAFYYFLILLILFYSGNEQEFIYFQF